LDAWRAGDDGTWTVTARRAVDHVTAWGCSGDPATPQTGKGTVGAIPLPLPLAITHRVLRAQIDRFEERRRTLLDRILEREKSTGFRCVGLANPNDFAELGRLREQRRKLASACEALGTAATLGGEV